MSKSKQVSEPSKYITDRNTLRLIYELGMAATANIQQVIRSASNNAIGVGTAKYWPYIPSYNSGLVEALLSIPGDKEGMKFMDLGCGIGNIMSLAALMGYDAYGVEYDHITHGYATQAAWLFKLHTYLGCEWNDGLGFSNKVFLGDITKTESKWNLNSMDVIFMYNPIRHHPTMKSVLEEVIEVMKEGAHLIYFQADTSAKSASNYKLLKHLTPQRNLSSNVWRKL